MTVIDINDFSKREEVVLEALVEGDVLSYSDLGGILSEGGWSHSQISIRLCITKIRDRLRKIGVEIRNRKGRGWYMPKEHKHILLNSIVSE